MVRPKEFRLNEQTAVNNYYQQEAGQEQGQVALQAQKEFDALAQKLADAGIRVLVFEDDGSRDTPDSLFPNNWFSTHSDGSLLLYPMFAENRRRERREDLLDMLQTEGFAIKKRLDYTAAEASNRFLEGTGSLVLDRVQKIAYCALSPRADVELLQQFCEDMGYKACFFHAYQNVEGMRLPIYHTNVMMSVGEQLAAVCLDALDDKQEREELKNCLMQSGKELLLLSEEQIGKFAGNMLEVENQAGQAFWLLSSQAYRALDAEQKAQMQKHGVQILHSELETIERLGGGSARCMLAEIFLPQV